MIVLWLLLAVAAAYQLLAIAACFRQTFLREPEPSSLPGVSVLKPVSGLDSSLKRAIESHLAISHPDYEVLVGVGRMDDPAVQVIEGFEDSRLRLVHATTILPNRKAGILADLAREAKYDVLVVNDGDIRVEPEYLRRLMGPLQCGNVGLVTCLYRAEGSAFPGRFEALGIATDFAPSALVAPMLGVNEFGLGSTLAFRKTDLHAIGGFQAVGPYLADDYQFGKRISSTGKRVWLSRMVVDTCIGGASWSDVWHHQVRWARTIRASRSAGYFGLPISNATAIALLAAWWGLIYPAISLLVLRYAMAICAAGMVLKDKRSLKLLWLTPVRDLFGLAVWAAGSVGNEVRWRDRRLRLGADGRIL